MADRSEYFARIAAARQFGLLMTRRQLQEFVRIMRQYADELAAQVPAVFAMRGEEHALRVAREIIEQLSKDMATSAGDTIRLTASEVAKIHAEAADILASDPDLRMQPDAIAAAAANTVLAQPRLASAFRSIPINSVLAVRAILQRRAKANLQTGLASELELHVLGKDALPARMLTNGRISYAAVRSLGYDATAQNLRAVRAEAGLVMGTADVLARTEPMAAEHEAAARSAIASPVVDYVRWRVSDHHVPFDICDLLQDVDWYGLGPGRFDPRQVPNRPHPRCACETIHVLLSVSDFGSRRGTRPSLIINPGDVAFSHAMSPSQTEQLASVFRNSTNRRRRTAA